MTTLFFILPFILIYVILAVYAERKLSAFIQDRLGPMDVGKYGTLQTVADLIKLIQKEDIVPAKADQILFKAAPVVIFAAVFTGFAVIPLNANWAGASIQAALLFLVAIISLDVIGILMAGWGSQNKYSVLGGMRSVAQILSYEVPLGLSLTAVVMVAGTLDLQHISVMQSPYYEGSNFLFGFPTSFVLTGFLKWNIFQMPFLIPVWIIFFISSLAECNRAPFDLPEAESELVAGFHTEYTGFRWAVIMLAEYGMMLLVSILGVVLFFGSWSSPLPDVGSLKLSTWTNGELGSITSSLWGIFWLIAKSLFFVCIQIWIRWTYPRLRLDQLLSLSWKWLTPFSIVLIIVCGFWKILVS